MEKVVQFILFGLFGLIVEIVFTSVKALLANRSFELKGETSLWMIPIYGLIAFVFPFAYHSVGHFEWYIRGLVYMFLFYALEYMSGFILMKIRVCPWCYPAKYSLNGLIYFPYAPFWFALGLGIERVYPIVVSMARTV